ncbi:MAG: hypothetical protein Q9222_007850 [Ikaeria aurantiellina]
MATASTSSFSSTTSSSTAPLSITSWLNHLPDLNAPPLVISCPDEFMERLVSINYLINHPPDRLREFGSPIQKPAKKISRFFQRESTEALQRQLGSEWDAMTIRQLRDNFNYWSGVLRGREMMKGSREGFERERGVLAAMQGFIEQKIFAEKERVAMWRRQMMARNTNWNGRRRW